MSFYQSNVRRKEHLLKEGSLVTIKPNLKEYEGYYSEDGNYCLRIGNVYDEMIGKTYPIQRVAHSGMVLYYIVNGEPVVLGMLNTEDTLITITYDEMVHGKQFDVLKHKSEIVRGSENLTKRLKELGKNEMISKIKY